MKKKKSKVKYRRVSEAVFRAFLRSSDIRVTMIGDPPETKVFLSFKGSNKPAGKAIPVERNGKYETYYYLTKTI